MFDPSVDVACYGAQILQYKFGRFCFSSPAFAGYDAGLIVLGFLKRAVRSLGKCKYVRFQCSHFLSMITIHVFLRAIQTEKATKVRFVKSIRQLRVFSFYADEKNTLELSISRSRALQLALQSLLRDIPKRAAIFAVSLGKGT